MGNAWYKIKQILVPQSITYVNPKDSTDTITVKILRAVNVIGNVKVNGELKDTVGLFTTGVTVKSPYSYYINVNFQYGAGLNQATMPPIRIGVLMGENGFGWKQRVGMYTDDDSPGSSLPLPNPYIVDIETPFVASFQSWFNPRASQGYDTNLLVEGVVFPFVVGVQCNTINYTASSPRQVTATTQGAQALVPPSYTRQFGKPSAENTTVLFYKLFQVDMVPDTQNQVTYTSLSGTFEIPD